LGAVDLLCESCQVGDLDAEGGGDPPDGAPGWVAAGLDVAEPGRVEISTVGDLLLRRDTASMASANLDLIRSIYAAWGPCQAKTVRPISQPLGSVGSGLLGSVVWEVDGGPGLLGGVLADVSTSLGRASSASLRRAHSNSFAMLRGVLMPAAYSTHRSAPERAFDRAGTRTRKMRGYAVGSGLKSRHRQADTRLVPKVAEKSVEPEPCPKTWQGKRCKLQKGHLEPCKYDL